MLSSVSRNIIAKPVFTASIARTFRSNALLLSSFSQHKQLNTYRHNSTAAVAASEMGKRPMTVNSELPDPMKGRTLRKVQFIAFLISMGIALSVVFNYEKTKSPVVSNTLYQLRRSDRIRDLLGNSIDMYGLMPWVYGELNQVQGNIDISFYVKGSKGKKGTVKLVANRENKRHEFLIHEWSIECEGVKIDLLGEDSNAKIM